MNIRLEKFGKTLTSRQLGKEAYNAFLPSLKSIPDNEDVIIDFIGVNTFSPSWGDEFLTNLADMFRERLKLIHTDNLSVKKSLELLEKISEKKFIIID